MIRPSLPCNGRIGAPAVTGGVASTSNCYAGQRCKREPVHCASLELLIRVEILPRCVQITVPHQPLDCDDVASVFEQAGGVRVAEFVERGAGHLRCGGDHFQYPQQVRLAVARFRGENPF